jgi:hypothetical protein
MSIETPATEESKGAMEILGNKYNTDKVKHHKYHEIYPMYLERMYTRSGAMLEIGIEKSSSLNMWLELFPNMHIYGMDKGVELVGPRHTVIKGDQSSESDLTNVQAAIAEPLWFINDDGSHVPEHQLLTFNRLFPALQVGGVYIIEDIETSYWVRGNVYGQQMRYGYSHPKSIVEIFKITLDNVNSEFAGIHETPVKHSNHIGSITFARNCIIITKKAPDNRRYKYARNTDKGIQANLGL